MSDLLSSIKKLREETLAPFGDCKKALEESGGDMSLAVDWLRKKGCLVGAKKTSRLALDGAIAADCHHGFGVILEVSCETDFVARSEPFKGFAINVLNTALERKESDLENFMNQNLHNSSDDSLKIADLTLNLAGKIGENIVLRRLSAIHVNPGVVVSYIHQPFPEYPKIGKLGVLVGLESQAAESDLQELGKNLAMHIAFANPQYASAEEIPADVLDKEKRFLEGQIQEQSADRPLEVQAKMVEGRLRKFAESIALSEQDYIREPGKKVKDIVLEESKRLGHEIRVASFSYIKLGECAE
jgi:elongation factor Ts